MTASDWAVEEGVRCVVCPSCAFTFDAFHTQEDGSYECPLCTPAPPPERGEKDALYDAIYEAVSEAKYGTDDVDPVGWATERIMEAIDLEGAPS